MAALQASAAKVTSISVAGAHLPPGGSTSLRNAQLMQGDESDIRRINPESGAVLERLEMPRGTAVSGMESDGADLFYCGGGPSGKVRAVRRPKRERR